MTEPTISVGRLGKPHGLSGAFRFLLTRELKSKGKQPKYLLVGKGGSPIPFFIKTIEWYGLNEGFINFEEITTPEGAKQYSGSELLVYEKDMALFKKVSSDFSYLTGYKAADKTEGEIGTIEEVVESPGQILLSITGRNVMIPLVDDFVVGINKRKKEIMFNLPEGLLDI